MLMPLDRRRGRPSPSDEPPENVLCLSTPGRVKEVSKPCPLQNSKILCATFSGCKQNKYEVTLTLIKFTIVCNKLNINTREIKMEDSYLS